MNRRNEWRRVEDKRREYYRSTNNLFKIALSRQLRPVIVYMATRGVIPDDRALVFLVRETRIQQAMEKTYERVGLPFAQDTARALLNKKDLIDDLEGFYRARIDGFFKSSIGQRITNITETTRNKITQIIREAFNEGLSVPGMARRIRERMTNINRARAVVISRSEIITASNKGSLIGAESLGVPLQKIWLSTPDSRVRITHAVADGQKKQLKDKFSVGIAFLEYPGDITGPGEETINCRCALGYSVT